MVKYLPFAMAAAVGIAVAVSCSDDHRFNEAPHIHEPAPHTHEPAPGEAEPSHRERERSKRFKGCKLKRLPLDDVPTGYLLKRLRTIRKELIRRVINGEY
jgi:hypothetical protein